MNKLITIKRVVTGVLLCVFSLLFNPAIANTDMQAMSEVQKARAKNRGGADHTQHMEQLDESEQFHGVYYGYLPCDDCAGIKMTLSLNRNRRYLLVTQHAQASTREYYDKGKYTWDEKKRLVTLISRKTDEVKTLRIKNKTSLVMMGPDGEPMKGNQKQYTLTNSENTKSRQVHIH